MEVQAKNPAAKGPADWFSGDVWVDAIAQGHGPTPLSIGAVHFTPGARTAWHSHEIGQTLYVMEGEGRVRTRGEAVTTIRAGDVVFIPANEWHWHGARPQPFHDAPGGHRGEDSVGGASHRVGVPACGRITAGARSDRAQ